MVLPESRRKWAQHDFQSSQNALETGISSNQTPTWTDKTVTNGGHLLEEIAT